MEIKFENGIIEISEIHNDYGWIVREFSDYRVFLFEVTPACTERYAGIFDSIREAINEGRSWT